MPRKLGTPASLPRSTPFAASDRQSPTHLVQSARRRLQYNTQLPVRSSSKRSISSQSHHQSKLASSLRKFTSKARAAEKTGDAVITAKFLAAATAPSGSPAARKSLSMSDLTPGCNVGLADFESGDFRSDSESNSARMEDNSSGRRTEETLSVDGCTLLTWSLSSRHRLQLRDTRESRAASIICRAMAINAWRCKRDENTKLKADYAQQLDLIQSQIFVLRRLLDNESARVVSLVGELHKAKSQNDELAKERDSLKIEKETAESEAQKQLEIAEGRLVSEENLRNELRSVRDQLDALDKQMAKDREKLLKLREDKKLLLDKVSVNEALVARANKAELLLEDAETQLAERIALADSLQEELTRVSNLTEQKEIEKSELKEELRKMEEDKAKLEENLRKSEDTGRALRLQAAELENELLNQESNVKRMFAAYATIKTEANELQEQLVRQSQESHWSSKVLQLAGSFVRAPRVILRTLYFFSTAVPVIL